jgi:phosphoribosylglycinamide formyltransferase-1
LASNLRIGALISGGGTNLQAVIDACCAKTIDGSLVFVGTDNPHAAGLARAIQHGIPTFSIDYSAIARDYKAQGKRTALPQDFNLAEILDKQALFGQDRRDDGAIRFFEARAVIEAKMLSKMKPYPFDLLILAGFMRTLTPYFIDRVSPDPANPRIMNIHPALLPAFPGLDGYADTFHYGCKVAGATVHFVDYGEDSGPIIAQQAFEIAETDTLASLKQKGLQNEWRLYPRCIQLFAENRLRIERIAYRLSTGKTQRRTRVKII